MAYDCFYTTKKTVKQGSKNISIKMLKDVGMTVPKSRETSVVYICSNTGNEGTIVFHYGVTHVIIVACPYPLSWCI